MTVIGMRRMTVVATVATVLASGALFAQSSERVQVPGGLAFSEFNGYEGWHLVSVSQDGPLFAAILANPTMITAYQAGIPGDGKPVPARHHERSASPEP